MGAPGILVNGYALKAIRQARGERIIDVANRADIDGSYLSNLESGRRRAMSPARVLHLCAALGVTDPRAICAVPSEGTVAVNKSNSRSSTEDRVDQEDVQTKWKYYR